MRRLGSPAGFVEGKKCGKQFLIGTFGGAFAGIVYSLFQMLIKFLSDNFYKRKLYNWLKSNTTDEHGSRFRSTRAISSFNNLTEDRVRYLCSINKNIHLSVGRNEDMWSIYTSEEDAPKATLI